MADTDGHPMIGSVWVDLDPRANGRLIRIVEIDGPYAVAELVGQPGRRSSTLRPDEPRRAEPGRRTRIRLDRLGAAGWYRPAEGPGVPLDAAGKIRLIAAPATAERLIELISTVLDVADVDGPKSAYRDGGVRYYLTVRPKGGTQ